MVSVLITTYNSAPFLEACLTSIRKQTHGSVEIIIVDNASTDGTRKILEAWGERAKTVFNENNIGFSAAQNQGIRAAAGDWLLALNPDVVLSPGFIAEMVGAGNLDPRWDRFPGSCYAGIRRLNRSFRASSIPPEFISRPACDI